VQEFDVPLQAVVKGVVDPAGPVVPSFIQYTVRLVGFVGKLLAVRATVLPGCPVT
jgi:hypothetical protein